MTVKVVHVICLRGGHSVVFNSVGMKVIYEPFNPAGLEVIQIIFSFVRREGSETLILVLHAMFAHFWVHLNFLSLKMT